jgi:isocitrate/isopropylmalate dehydrogenase
MRPFGTGEFRPLFIEPIFKMMKRIHRIAVIPGDGIGTEVISEGIKCLKTLSEIFKDLRFQFEYFPWGSDYYLQQGRMMPEKIWPTPLQPS